MDKIDFVNNSAPALSAKNLNKLQTNVENAIADTIIPSGNGVKDLGSSTNQYRHVRTHQVIYDNGNAIAFKWNSSGLELYVDDLFIGKVSLYND